MQRDPDDDKQLKVSLPARQHIDLHRIKVLTGQNLSETVEDAIEVYLETLREDGELDDLDDHEDLPDGPAS